ncbi:PDZ/DHR/GLGF domain-containing protein [Marssonina coronariae]|uniref:PDZ/DHR/GLGF domain-containing protein n=1 Tax=Diplocarpon coronariae TaxID=2795749 RepID=A0A218YVY4_9HELO|nr:PDZ/DHR/GLGF domain-containing protein [Marssonina coronariae]
MLPSTPLALRVSPSLRRASFLRHRTAPATTHSASDGPAHKSDWDAREAGPVIRSGMPFQTPYYGSPGKEISGASSMARGVKTAAAGVHGDGDGECQGGIQRLAGRSPQESAGENECRSDDQEQDGSEDGWGADAEGDLDVGPENGDGVFATTPSTPPPAPDPGSEPEPDPDPDPKPKTNHNAARRTTAPQRPKRLATAPAPRCSAQEIRDAGGSDGCTPDEAPRRIRRLQIAGVGRAARPRARPRRWGDGAEVSAGHDTEA